MLSSFVLRMPLLSILVVFGGFMGFDLNKQSSWTAVFLIVGAVVFLLGLLGFFLIEEPHKKADGTNHYFANIVYGFRLSVVRKNPVLYATLLAFAVFGISIQIFMPYLILYYEVSLGMKDYVLIMAPAIILASVATAFWGKVYDKKGFSRSSFWAMLWLVLGYLTLILFKNTALVFVGSLLMMCGYLSGMAVFGAKIRDLTPIGKSGMFQGVKSPVTTVPPAVVQEAVQGL